MFHYETGYLPLAMIKKKSLLRGDNQFYNRTLRDEFFKIRTANIKLSL